MDFVGDDVCKRLAGTDGECLWFLGGGTGPLLLPSKGISIGPQKKSGQDGYLRLFNRPVESLS